MSKKFTKELESLVQIVNKTFYLPDPILQKLSNWILSMAKGWK